MIWLVSALLFLIFFVLAFIAGFVLRALTRGRDMDMITIYAQGMVVILLIFMACAEFCALTGASVKFAGALWLAAIFTLEIFFLFMDRRRFPRFFKSLRVGFKSREKGAFTTNLLAVIVTGIIILQMIFLIGFAADAPNALRGISDATLAYETGRIMAGSPMMMLYAWLAGLVKVHPMTLIFTVAPVLLLPMYYSIEWSLARKLFAAEALGGTVGDTNKCLYMMFIFELLHICGYQSNALIGTTLLFSYFSGEAFLIHAVLPFTLWFILDYIEKREASLARSASAEQTGVDNTMIRSEDEDWDMKHRIVNARNVGIAMIVLAVVFAGMVFILNRKINSLHEATVGLQENLERSLRTYEFVPDGAERAEAFVIRQSNGALLVIGGGGTENGDALYDFIQQYGNSVESWYLNGNGKEDTGAYEVCKDRGIEVGDVYTLGVEELTK